MTFTAMIGMSYQKPPRVELIDAVRQADLLVVLVERQQLRLGVVATVAVAIALLVPPAITLISRAVAMATADQLWKYT